MVVRVGINGFGRIGRGFLRAVQGNKDFDIVAANDLTDEKTLGHLLRYDTVMGRFDGTVETGKGKITVNGDEIKVLSERDPAKLPWKELGVDIVIESTGFFRKKEDAEKHLAAGAKKVLLSAPGKGDMFTVVLGVNDEGYDPANHHIISNASCTTNCLAPLVKVVDETFGLQKGLMTTIHAVTNDQRMLDMPHSDLRRARAACWNIIPTTTGAAKAIGLVYPKAKGKLDGMAMRVPTPVVSIVDFVATLKKSTSVKEVNNLFREAAENDLKNVLAVSEDELVSMDFKMNKFSSIVDLPLTMVNENLVKICSWYDNEFGYTCRLVEMAEFMGKK